MTTEQRNLTQIGGANVTTPTQNGYTATGWVVFANDAAFEAIYGAGQQGDAYFNSTELVIRTHNGTEWVYDQNGINALEDSTTTGSNQEVDPTYHNLLKLTNVSLGSVWAIDPAQTKIVYLTNATGSNVLLLNEDPGATAAHRLILPDGATFTLSDGETAHFVYDSLTSRWRYTNAAGSGGGGTGTGLLNFMANGDFETGQSGWTKTAGSVLSLDTSTQLEGTASLTWTNDGGLVQGDLNTVDLAYRGYAAQSSARLRCVGIGGNYKAYLTDDGVMVPASETDINLTGGGTVPITMFGFTLDGSVYKYVIESVDGDAADVLTLDIVNVTTQGTGEIPGTFQYDDSEVTFDATPTGWSTYRAVFMPYRDAAGLPRMIFNISGSMTSASNPSNIDIAGVTWKNTTDFTQAVAIAPGSAGNYARAVPNTGEILARFNTAQTSMQLSGNLELESWPTWATKGDSLKALSKGAVLQNAKGSFNDTSGQTISNAVFTALTFNGTEKDDSQGQWDGSKRWTANRNGFLEISVSKEYTSSFANAYFIRVVKNGSTEVRRIKFPPSSGASPSLYGSWSDIYLLSGEYIEVEAYQTEGANRSFNTTASQNYIDINWQPDDTGNLATGAGTDDLADEKPRKLIPNVQTKTGANGEGDLGAITNWATVDSAKYRWYVVGKVCFYEHRIESSTTSSSASNIGYDLPNEVPPPKEFSNQNNSEWVLPMTSLRIGTPSASYTRPQDGTMYNNSGTLEVYGYTDTPETTRLWIMSAFWQVD